MNELLGQTFARVFEVPALAVIRERQYGDRIPAGVRARQRRLRPQPPFALLLEGFLRVLAWRGCSSLYGHRPNYRLRRLTVAAPLQPVKVSCSTVKVFTSDI